MAAPVAFLLADGRVCAEEGALRGARGCLPAGRVGGGRRRACICHDVSYGEPVKALVIGCGRVGSNVALQLAEEGWEVTAVVEKEEALTRLGEHWRSGLVMGQG